MLKKSLIIAMAGVVALAAFGLYYYLSNRNPSPPTFIYAFASDRQGNGDIFVLDQHGQIQNLTDHPQADWDPAWSQDGHLLAFTSHRTGNSDIWLLDLHEPDHPQQLTEHPAWDYSPAWSPSCRSVAFVSERDGDPEIFVQHFQEDTAIQLTFNQEMDRLPAWSPDGKYIAFAAVRNGIETIHRIRPDGTDEQFISPSPLQGTSPAWSPDGSRLAFIGWETDHKPGIYLVGPEPDRVELRYQADSRLASLHWSGDWLTFTSWRSGNHELYALPVEGGGPVRLTINEAWDDFLILNPIQPFATRSQAAIAQAAPALKLPPNPHLAMGVNIADLSLAYLVNDMGFDWAKSYVNWATVEPEPGQFRWTDPDNIVKAFGDQQLKTLMRVHGTPTWARPADSSLSHPPADMEQFGNFLTALADRYRGRVAAYEIWNEPNLYYEWGYLKPDPAAYTEMLQTAYTAIKAADPDALVISGGLATTGQGSPTAYGDLAFLEEMYRAGAKGYFDGLGSHPYAYGLPPDESHPDGLSLDRVVAQREIMRAYGDGQTPIWITELGWVLQTNWDLGEHAAIGVTEQQQAEYLSRAYAKVQTEWPFVEAVFLFNLDFSAVSWYPAPEPMRWYAILNPDRTPRPAYIELRHQMRQR